MALRKTLLQLRTGTRNYLDEASPNFWSDPQLTTYVNEGKDRVQTEVRKLAEDFWDLIRLSTDGNLTILGTAYNASSFRLVPGTTSYALPPDLLELRTTRVITAGSEFIRMVHKDVADPDFRAARALADNQSPSVIYFAQTGESNLLIAPKLDTTLDLELLYVPIVADMVADGDGLEMPWPLYVAVQEYAAATALLMDRDPNAAAWEAKGNASVARFLGSTERQSQDVEVVRGYMQGDE